MDRQNALRLASVIAGLDNHADLISDREYAYRLTRNFGMVREYHALLCIANRLETLVADAEPPVQFVVPDISDGALRCAVPMHHTDEAVLMRYVRHLIIASPIYQIEITAEREVILWSFVYDHAARTSSLAVFDSSIQPIRRAS